jgi:hypothetical protein
VTIRYRVRVRNRVHTLTKHATIRRGRYRLTFSLSPTFARPSKATISVAYAGDSDTLADARTSTWRLVR